MLRSLNDWPAPTCAGLFVGRGRQAENLQATLASHAQIHVAEGALRPLRPDNGGTWRKEQRDCALIGWLASVASAQGFSP